MSLIDQPDPTETANTSELSSNGYTDVHFVPVDIDGDWFSPKHKKNGQYVVRDKDNELSFEDFLEALEKLSVMEVPIWQKPSAKSRWIQAVGLEWTRKTSDELGLN